MAFFYYNQQPTPFTMLDRAISEALRPAFRSQLDTTNPKTSDALRSSHSSQSWTPRMDLHEDAETNTITAIFELPGLKKENVNIDVIRDHLTVSGEISVTTTTGPEQPGTPNEEETTAGPRTTSPADDGFVDVDAETSSGPVVDGNGRNGKASTSQPVASPRVRYAIRERRWGKFTRTLKLPRGVKADQIQAKMEDGVLTISFPRTSSEEGPHRVTIF